MSDLAGLQVPGLTPDEIEALGALPPGEFAEFMALMEQALEGAWVLTPKQELAEILWRKVDWLLYGGSAAGGKSEFACWHADQLSRAIPGHVTLMLRQSIPELRRSLILRMIARVKQFRLPTRLRKVDGQTGFHYDNTALIECGFLATDEHLGNYLSAEYDCIIIDEATQLSPDQIVGIAGRLRTTKRKAAMGARPHLGMFTNPGDVAHAWMYDLIVTPTMYGSRVVVYNIANGIENRVIARTYDAPMPLREASLEDIDDVLIPWAESLQVEVDPQNELAVAFVPSKATDNPHIDPSYLKFLNSLPERRRRQLRDGDWDVFEGQYFHEWDRNVHVVPPFDIPESWPRARGVDYGSTNPWCCLWGAWDNDGNCYVYREAYAAGLTPEMQAKQAADLSVVTKLDGTKIKERYERTVADPSVFSEHRRGHGRSVAQMWSNCGFQVTKARNDRVAGWANVRQYLWDHEGGPDGTGAPRLFVFETCHNLARTLPLQRHDRLNQEDLDTRGEDHAADALRYLLATRPIGERQRRHRTGQSIDQRFQQMMNRKRKRGGPSWT